MQAFLAALAACARADRPDLVETVVLPKALAAAAASRTDMREKEIHAERSVKVMQFGSGAPAAAKQQKKKKRIRPGSAQEEEALNKMVELITDVRELRGGYQ